MEEKNVVDFFEKYCQENKLSFGNLYVHVDGEITRRIELYRPSEDVIKEHGSFLYDEDTGNVHIFPERLKDAKDYANRVCTKRKEILEKIKYLRKNEKYNCIIPKEKRGNQTRAFNETQYKEAEKLFLYSRFTYKETNYDLAFNRFFFDKSNRVNCILLCFQVEMSDVSEEYPNIRNKSPLTKNYPDTPLDGEDNESYYNLDVDIYSSAEDIAKAFLEFVLKKEKEKAQQKEEPENK